MGSPPSAFGVCSHNIALLLMLLVWLASISSVTGLKCYYCRNNHCHGRYGREIICEPASMKFKCGMAMGRINGRLSIHRDCFPETKFNATNSTMGCQNVQDRPLFMKAMASKGIWMNGRICFCDTDLCNGNSKHDLSSTMILVTVVITVLSMALFKVP